MALKMYAWQPKCHGPLTFATIADSEEEARRHVDEWLAKEIAEHPKWDWDLEALDDEPAILGVGEVLCNGND